jgi:hypothetical protein
MSDHPIGPDLLTGVPDVPHRHRLAHGDDRHVGQAIVLTGDLLRIDRSQDQPYRRPISQVRYLPAPLAPPSPELGPPIPEDDLDAVTLTHGQVRTVRTTLDIAAERRRDRARTCTDRAYQSCVACKEADQ